MKISTFLLLLLWAASASGQETRYAGDPLLLGAGARPLGMGGAFVAVSDEATSVYWNPAGLPLLKRREVQLQHAEQFGGTVNHDVFTVAAPHPVGGFGLGLFRIGVDGIKLTALEDPSRPLDPGNRPIVTDEVGTTDYTLHLAYGRTVRDDLSLGAVTKLIWRNLSSTSGSGYGLDVGALYRPRTDLSLGLVVRNLTRTTIRYDGGVKDRISPSALLGAAYTRDVERLESVLVASASFHLGETTSSIEDVQTVQLGVEGVFREQLAFRLGFQGDHFTAGTGVRLYDRVGFDLAFLGHGGLENTYRISAAMYF